MKDHTLRTLHRERQRQEERALKNWSAAAEQRAHSERLRDQLHEARQSALPAGGEITGAKSLRARQQFGERLHTVCAQAAQRITQSAQVEQQRRAQFQEARRETLVIEKLQERARQRALVASGKAEQSMLDDFVASRFGG